MESRYRAEKGVYHLFTLKNRFNARQLPSVRIVDMRQELRGRKDAAVLGPAPLPVVRVSNRYRYRVTLHCRFDKEIRTLVSGLLIQCNTAKEYKGVSVFADYNPME